VRTEAGRNEGYLEPIVIVEGDVLIVYSPAMKKDGLTRTVRGIEIYGSLMTAALYNDALLRQVHNH